MATIPQFPVIEKEEKEKSLFQKILDADLDTEKLDEVWQYKRYIDKYGISKFLEEKEKLDKKKEEKKEAEKKKPIGFKKTSSSGVPKFEKVEDEFTLGDERITEVGLGESVGNAILSGAIKIPLGFANLVAEIKDLFAEEGLPVDRSAVNKLNNWFESTVLGDIMKYSEEKARETATGKITEALAQLVGAYKTVGTGGIKIFNKGADIADKMINAYKKKKYIKSTGKEAKHLYSAAKKVNQLKKASYGRDFGAVAFGGALSAAGVYDIEDIGTFGDLFFDEGEWTALDRREGKDADDDAARRMWNRVKFGAELGFPIVPFIYGVGRVGKLIATGSKNNAYSNSLFERWVDKWIASPFRARGKKPLEVAREVRRAEGREASAQLIAEDFLRNIDDKTKEILKIMRPVAVGTSKPEVLSKMLANLLISGKDIIKGGKITFNTFDPKSLDAFHKATKALGIPLEKSKQLVAELFNIRKSFTGFKNSILQGQNITKGTEEFNKIMLDRFQNGLASDFRILTDKNVFKSNTFIPAREVKEEVANIFLRYAKANGSKMTKHEAHEIVDEILKNVEMNPITRTPEFPFAPQSALADVGVHKKNIAENIVGGKFKPDKAGGLIQTEKDLTAFKKLFGEYKNANQIIANTMQDLAGISAKNTFYNNIIKAHGALTKAGERGLVYKTYREAQKAFPNKKIIQSPNGLKLSSGLPDELYKSPLDGMFTTTEIAEALKFADDLPLSALTKSLGYRWLVMIPKGAGQVGKTVLGPFTHSRNFFSGAVTTLSTGNIFIPPQEIAKNLSIAWKTIQPQTMYRITGNPKWRNIRGANTADPTKMVDIEEGGQGLYQFLLDESVVNSNATYRDVLGLLKDIQKGGDFLSRVWNKFPKAAKGLMKWSQDMYIAEDDIWKVFNFLGESYKINRAFTNALNAGKITKAQIPNKIEMYQEAARIVRNTIPNYSYVPNFVQGVRRSPLGNFASFPAEIIRTTGNIVEEGMTQIKGGSKLLEKYGIKENIFARNGYERLFGAGAAWAAVPTMAYYTMKGLYGISKEKMRAIREMVAPWSEDSTLLPYVNEDGSYGYVDFSHGFFYDTVVNPIQAVTAQVDKYENEPLTVGMGRGIMKAMSRLLKPFVDESIWMGVAMDVLVRNGETRDGRRIFNEREPLGDKWWKAIKHATYTMSPGSLPQLKRLYAAAMDETIKGQKYEVPKEMAGFFGFRGVDIKPDRTLDFRIQDFNRDKRAERNLIYMGTLTGDPVKDEDLIVKQFILANKQHLETMNKIKRTVDAAKTLGLRDKEIRQIFRDRGQGSLYNRYLRRNKFQPFTISDKMKKAYRDLAEEKNIPNPLTKSSQKRINKIIKRLRKQRLNSDYIIREEDWMSALPTEKTTQMSALPETPGVNPALMSQVLPSNNVMETGLTPTEQALLSDEEKGIRLRQRGMTG